MISSPLWQLVGLLAVHWVADFVLQTHWQASNKSKSLETLSRHVAVYTAALMVGSAVIFGITPGLPLFVLVNGGLHFATDYYTSRWSSRLFASQFTRDGAVWSWTSTPVTMMKPDFNPHNFFVVIGLDQLVHQATLAATMWLFLAAGRYP